MLRCETGRVSDGDGCDPGTVIRRARPTDADVVRALRLDALAGAPDAFGSTFERESAFADQVWVDRLQPDAHPTFLWEDGDVVRAMAVGVVDAADPSLAFLFAMWVEPSCRGRGVGKAIVEAVCDWARSEGARRIRLHVSPDNDAAERLYRRCGFELTGRSEPGARDGHVGLEMERALR